MKMVKNCTTTGIKAAQFKDTYKGASSAHPNTLVKARWPGKRNKLANFENQHQNNLMQKGPLEHRRLTTPYASPGL